MSGIYQLTVGVLFVLSVALGQRSGDVYLLFTDSSAKQIWKLDVNNSNYTNIVIENHENPIAIDYDPVMNKIYWTDVGRPDIRKCGFNGENLTLVRKLKPGSVPDGLTLDPVSRLIFYTDTGNDIIALMDMDDYYHKTIINTNLDQPRGIALDRTQRMMYWTDWGAEAKIERATYLGESRTTLVSTGLIWPNGITLDTGGQKMYWCDAKTNVIEVLDFDGNNRRQIAHRDSFHPFDIFLFEQVLYTTDWTSKRIYQVYLDERNMTSLNGSHFKRLNGIHVFRAGAFQNDTNTCTTNKGGCEQICIPTSGGRQCACRDGYTLITNGLNCTGQADVFALFTDSLAKQIWKLDVINSIYSNIVIENHENPIAIDYDPVMNKIYWTDVGRPDIRKCGFNGEDLSLVRKLKPGSVPDGLTLDPVSRLIFYTDTGNDVIALMDMDDYYHKTIINTNLDQPRGIALDRTQRMMYWTDWGEKPKIERATYLGESRTTLVSTGLIWPNGITLDTQGKKIYWCDAKIHKIEAMDYDGRNRRQIAHGSSFHPFDIFLFEQVLYTTDWGSRRIFRVYLDGRNETSWGGRHFKRLNGIHVFRAGAFQNDTNACTTNKGGCEQICIPTSGGRQCTCRDGYTLTTNGLHCTAHNACSWCYPGQCGGELSANCVCHPGFTGQHCQTITTKPAMHVLVQMTNSDEQRFEIDSTDNQASFWTNVNNPTSVHYNLSAQYTAQSSGTLPDKTAYIEDFHVGIVQGTFDFKLTRGSLLVANLHRTCKAVNATNPRSDVNTCDEVLTRSVFPTRALPFQNTDRIRFLFETSNGGYVKVRNKTTGVLETFFYEGQTKQKSYTLNIDVNKPYHCSIKSPCGYQMINADDVIKRTDDSRIYINTHGWTDDESGIDTLNIQIIQLRYSAGKLQTASGNTVFQTTVNVSQGQTVGYTLTLKGVYGILLSARDKVNNERKARSIVLYDPISTITTNKNQPLVITSAVESTNYTWQLDTSAISVEFTDRFINSLQTTNNWLAPVADDSDVDSQYDDHEGEITVAGIPNKQGIVKFKTAYVVNPDGDELTREPEDGLFQDQGLKTVVQLHPRLVDGDLISVWVKAYDVKRNVVSEQVHVQVDSSPPVILKLALEEDINKETILRIEVSDENSGIERINWKITDTATDISFDSHVKKVPALGVTSCSQLTSLSEAKSCYCTPRSVCYSKEYSLKLMNVQEEKPTYVISVTVWNNAHNSVTRQKEMSPSIQTPGGEITKGEENSFTWGPTFERLKGIQFYKYAFGPRCFTMDEVVSDSPDIKVIKTTETSVSWTAPSAGDFYLTVVAFDSASQPIQSKCSGVLSVGASRADAASDSISIPILGAAAAGAVVVIVIIIIVVVVVVKRRRAKKADSEYEYLDRSRPTANREAVFNIAYGLDDDSTNDSPQRPTCTNEADIDGPYSKLGADAVQLPEGVYDVIGHTHFESSTDFDYPFSSHTEK